MRARSPAALRRARRRASSAPTSISGATYHRYGCELWFLAERDTRTNEVLRTEVPERKDAKAAPQEAAVPDTPAV